MTEIEKAILDLKTSVSLLQLERGEHEAYRSKRTVEAIEALIDTKLAEHADRIRAIAREEIEAALEPMPKVYVVKTTPINQEGGDRNQLDRRPDREDNSPPAVEAPAAGACPHCNGSGLFLGGRLSVTPPKCPRCYGSGKAEDVSPRNAVEAEAMEAAAADEAGLADMTALARRLAEALVTARSWSSVMIKHADLEQIDDALAEARQRLDDLVERAPDDDVLVFHRGLIAVAASLLSRWPGGWRPIETAPKDGTAVLLRLKQHFTDNRPDLDRFRGVHFVGRNVGSSMDWCFAAPVGYGGFPDEWFDGWMPIPEPPNE